MQQPPTQLLLLGQDSAAETLLPQAGAHLNDGGCAVLVASYATSSTIGQLEPWYALKNQHLEQLTLLFVLRDEPQLYPVLEGELTPDHLAKLQPSVFDAVRVSKAIIAGTQQWIDAQSAALLTLGVDPLAIELQPQSIDAPSAQTVSSTTPEVAVRVTMQGREFEFGMAQDGGTVLDAAEDAGLDLPYSCRGGVCSTCRTRVLQGSVSMLENSSLDTRELDNGYVLACQAVPETQTLHISYDDV